jgi:hypothetical protein
LTVWLVASVAAAFSLTLSVAVAKLRSGPEKNGAALRPAAGECVTKSKLLPFRKAAHISVLALVPAMLAITAVHFAADWWKVRFGDRIPGPPIGPFLLDQLIHLATLIGVLSLALAQAQVWQISASPFARLALYGSAYIIAAFATPIGVMIWLDPGFSNAALAGGTRLRSVLAGASAVSLAIFGGLLALPATLIGMTMLARHPRSNHPLDLPAGMLAVLCVGATVGTVLALMQ